jgi:hypothetical protein
MLKAMHALLHHDLEIPKERQLKEYFFRPTVTLEL